MPKTLYPCNYHEVVRALHPALDSENTKMQLDVSYSYNSSHFASGYSQPDDNPLNFVLMLAIAAQAQMDTIPAKLAAVMHSRFQHAANITATTASMKQAIIVLLW